MKKLIVVMGLCGLVAVGNCWADNDGREGSKIGFKELPVAVQQESMKYFEERNIKEIEKNAEVDIVQYDVEGISNGQKLDIKFAPDGTVIQTSVKVELTALPLLAQKALQKDYPGMEIKEVEKAVQTVYKVEIIVDGKKREVEVKASGDIEDANDMDGENDGNSINDENDQEEND